MPLGLLPSPAIRPDRTASQLSGGLKNEAGGSALTPGQATGQPRGRATMVTSIPIKPGSSSFAVPGFDVR
jgi:hypothetical protein